MNSLATSILKTSSSTTDQKNGIEDCTRNRSNVHNRMAGKSKGLFALLIFAIAWIAFFSAEFNGFFAKLERGSRSQSESEDSIFQRILKVKNVAIGRKVQADVINSEVINSKGSNHGNAAQDSCFRARTDTVPPESFGQLPKPFINLGFPKMGSTSIYEFFKCGGHSATHYWCGKKNPDGYPKCSLCTKKSVNSGLPPLSECGQHDVYAQLDDGMYFPQMELLEEFVNGPDATFFLTFRDMENWVNSLRHWPKDETGSEQHMDERLKGLNIKGLPKGKGKNVEEFSEWFCNHVQRVRNIFAENPRHTLVEVDIEDAETSQRMAEIFGIDQSCWGQANVNTNIHPDISSA